MKLRNPFRRRPKAADHLLDYHVLSFSQEGEDRLLARLLEGSPPGFYVDVGAHHPQRFSNTYAFYLRGWRGLNLDPAPGTRELFDRLRPRDINLEMAVGLPGNRFYHQFAESALNGFDAELSEQRQSSGQIVLERRLVQTVPLAEVLDRFLPAETRIDFLNVDVEGLDLEVLRSNDWSKHRPRLVLAEERERGDLAVLLETPVVHFLRDQGYRTIARTLNTVVFREQ